jgi:pimeloyl-ACP methyl ester carboxylesterase
MHNVAPLCGHLSKSSVLLNGWSLGGAVVVDYGAKLGSRLEDLALARGATAPDAQAASFPPVQGEPRRVPPPEWPPHGDCRVERRFVAT